MWTEVFMARDRSQVGKLRDILSSKGIITKIRPVGGAVEEGGYYEILVPGAEVLSAQNLIFEPQTA